MTRGARVGAYAREAVREGRGDRHDAHRSHRRVPSSFSYALYSSL